MKELTDDDRHAVPLFRRALSQLGDGTFVGIIVLAGMIDYFELMRRGADWPKATAWILAEISIFRIPQLTEHIMPFAILVGAMSCYLTLSRRLELVIARSAGISAWQFVAPALLVAFLFGAVATVAYNPIAAMMHERSKRLEEQMLDETPSALQASAAVSGFVRRAPMERPSSTRSPAANKAPASAPSQFTPSTRTAHSRSASRPVPPNSETATGSSTTPTFIRRSNRLKPRSPIGSPVI